MDKRRMCPHCRAFVTTADKVCPYCEGAIGPRSIDLRMPDDLLGGLLPHGRFVTALLLVICSGLFVATAVVSSQAGNPSAFMGVDGRTLVAFGAMFRPAIRAGEWWRLITAGFLHGGLLHIAMNGWAMFDIGAQVEELYGTGRTVAIFVISTITGFFLSFLLGGGISIGASAGLFGFIGAMIAVGVLHRSAMAQAIKSMYMRSALYGIVIGFLGFLPIDNWAHIGGLAGGFGVAWLSGLERKDGGIRDRAWRWAGAFCAVVAGLSLIRALAGFLA